MDKRKVVSVGVGMLLVSGMLVGCAKEGANTDKGTQNESVTSTEVETSKEDAKKFEENNVADNIEDVEKPTKEELAELDKKKEEELSKDVKVGAKVDIWIPNVEYISSGDESLDKLVKVSVDSVHESNESDKYMRMLKTLKVSGDSPITVLDFKSTKLVGDTLEIDIANPSDLGIGGSTTELMIVEQLKATIFNNFEEVKNIQLKIDGKIVTDFLGHIDISQPFKR